MGKGTNIAWTDSTYNIAVGCTKVNSDCLNCYMYRESLKGTRYDASSVRRTKTVFNLPLRTKESQRFFTSSLTDFFHEEIDSFRNEAWDIIRKCPQHTFQILTKRPERIKNNLPRDWGDGWDNVHLGVSCGQEKYKFMIDELLQIPSKIYFASLEPLYAPIEIEMYLRADWRNSNIVKDVKYLDWVIVGGESGYLTGNKYVARPCKLEWIERVVESCVWEQTPVFVKQLGTVLAKELNLKHKHGSDFEEFPSSIKYQELP